MKKLVLIAMASLLATTAFGAKQFDYMPDDGMAIIGHNQKALLKQYPFIRDTMKVRFNEKKGLIVTLPATLAESTDSPANGLRFIRYEYPELYYPKDASATPQVYLDIQKEPMVEVNPQTTALEKEFAKETVNIQGENYVVRMASSSQYPNTDKEYFPLVMRAATASLDRFDPSKPYYTQDRIPWSLMEPIQGVWGSSAYKTVLTVKDYRINSEPVEAIYNVSEDNGSLSMSIITVDEDVVRHHHLVVKEEASSVMTKETVLYVDGERTTQAKNFSFGMGINH